MRNIIRKASKFTQLIRNGRYRNALFKHKVAAAIEHSKIISSLELNTILDVGANTGQFSLLASNEHPNAKIYAFEPLDKPATTYQALFENEEKMELIRSAVGQTTEVAVMNISNSIDSSSLLPITSTQSNIFPGTHAVDTEQVQVSTLANLIDNESLASPVLMKIDVQGFELEVLKGSASILRKIDHIYVECSFIELYKGQALATDIIKFLINENYTLVGIYNVSHNMDGHAVQADMHFARQHTE